MFEIITDESTNTYSFIYKTINNQVILTGLSYFSKAETEHAIANCKTAGLKKISFERKTASNGKFHFIVKDDKHRIIAKSMYYTSEVGMQNGIESFRNYCIASK